jgi:hypothetical protein
MCFAERKFAMIYISKTETTHAGTTSSSIDIRFLDFWLLSLSFILFVLCYYYYYIIQLFLFFIYLKNLQSVLDNTISKKDDWHNTYVIKKQHMKHMMREIIQWWYTGLFIISEHLLSFKVIFYIYDKRVNNFNIYSRIRFC